MLRSNAYTQGDVGEVLVASSLRNKCDMLVLRNLYFPSDNHFTEVDIIALSKLGVFIVESKNYSGSISGSRDSKYWSVLYSKYHTERLFNPVLQNKIHKDAVRCYLNLGGFKDVPIYRPVIFNDKCNLQLQGCEKLVFTLANFIEQYRGITSEFITSDTINDLYDYLKPLSDQSLEMKMLHLDLLKHRKELI